jgi:MraZ protein
LEQSGATVFRGSYTAKIDDKGRLKLPNAFKALVADQHGPGLYVTSVTGHVVQIYPMATWRQLEQRLAAMPNVHPARARYVDRVSYYGQEAEFDIQGRVIIHPRLREAAGMTGEVDVLGSVDHFEVWNHDRFLAKLQNDPFTDDDARALAEFGI